MKVSGKFEALLDPIRALKEEEKSTAPDEDSVAGALLQISISNVANEIPLSI